MPPQRTALRAIKGNNARNKDLISYIRGKIINMTDTGISSGEIKTRYKVS